MYSRAIPSRRRPLLFPGCLLALTIAGLQPLPSSAQFLVTNLVSDQSGVAKITDGNLVNAWGISFSATSPFWVSSNGKGLSTLYKVDPVTNVPVKQGLEVAIPGDGSVTGQVFNPGLVSGAFDSDIFLFVSEDGTISGWKGGSNALVIQTGDASHVYKGVAAANVGGHTYLYAANFKSGAVDVLKGDGSAPNLTGSFTDPTLPANYAPFGIQKIGNTIYVTYALQGSGRDDDPGAGHGFVSAFDLNGNFLGRIGSQGDLNSPWGLAVAPSTFGAAAGDLLVGNFGDGRINVFSPDPSAPAFLGQLADPLGKPLVLDGLWGLMFGNGGGGGNKNLLYFSAGPNDESNGLFGSIQAVPEPGSVALLTCLLLPGAALLRRRRR